MKVAEQNLRGFVLYLSRFVSDRDPGLAVFRGRLYHRARLVIVDFELRDDAVHEFSSEPALDRRPRDVQFGHRFELSIWIRLIGVSSRVTPIKFPFDGFQVLRGALSFSPSA